MPNVEEDFWLYLSQLDASKVIFCKEYVANRVMFCIFNSSNL